MRCYGVGVKAVSRSPGSYLVIELANLCSLACVHCSVADTSHSHFDQTGYLDVRLAEALFADLANHQIGFDTLILFWLGEPLLHPEFSRIWAAAIRAAGEHETFGKVEVHTNATHLSPKVTCALLNEADLPSVIHFSLDATDRARYLAVKAKDRFDEVVHNIEHFLGEKARLGARWPRPVFQFIVGENNVDQVPAFRAMWTAACERVGLDVSVAAGHVPPGEDAVVFFRQLDCPSAARQAMENSIFRMAMLTEGLSLPEQSRAGQRVNNENSAVCAGFWKSPVVSWDGVVTTCTRDSRLDNAVGRLADTPFTTLWWGETMRQRRALVSQSDYSGLSACQKCFIPKSLNYTGISADEIDAFPEPL